MVIQLFHDRRLQIVDAAKDATANARLGDVSKNRSTRLTQEAAMDMTPPLFRGVGLDFQLAKISACKVIEEPDGSVSSSAICVPWQSGPLPLGRRWWSWRVPVCT